MKKRLLLGVFMLFGVTAIQAQCNAYFPAAEGASFQLTEYSRKGKVLSHSRHQVMGTTTKGNTSSTAVRNDLLDKKQQFVNARIYTVECQGSIFYIDLSQFLNHEAFAECATADMTVVNAHMDLPSNVKAGDELNDAQLIIQLEEEGIKIAEMTVSITNRRVEGEEEVNTTAGTYDCVKVSYTAEITVEGISTLTIKGNVVDWYALGVGVVRSESYDSKGKLFRYRELTVFTSP